LQTQKIVCTLNKDCLLMPVFWRFNRHWASLVLH